MGDDTAPSLPGSARRQQNSTARFELRARNQCQICLDSSAERLWANRANLLIIPRAPCPRLCKDYNSSVLGEGEFSLVLIIL